MTEMAFHMSRHGRYGGPHHLQELVNRSSQLLIVLAIVCLSMLSAAQSGARASIIGHLCNIFVSSSGPWQNGRATYYGHEANSWDNEHYGACGYGTLTGAFVGFNYAAASPVIWQNGQACGTCMEVKCRGNGYPCRSGVARVTITDLCPPIPPNMEYCAGGKAHIDLGVRMFPIIADPVAGRVPILFRTVPCARFSDLQVNIRGNSFGWLALVVMRVPGPGRVSSVEVKASGSTRWEPMRRDFGASFARTGSPMRAPISVRLSVFGKLCRITATDCVPRNWHDRQRVTCSYRAG